MKQLVLTLGRWNPPTKGHEIVFNKVKSIAIELNCDYQIWVSHSQDNKKNPLPQSRKLYYLDLIFPDTIFIGTTSENNSIFHIMKHVNEKYSKIILVVGSDRKASFDKILNEYNGTEYNFEEISVISAGDRNTSDNISATMVRNYVKEGNYHEFVKCLPLCDTEISFQLYEELKRIL